jgi:hypothetical protein
MHEVSDCARSDALLTDNVWHDFAFSSTERDQHLEVRHISQLNTQPMASPVNASRLNSRVTAHHSGPRQLAKPYLVGDFHLLSFASLSWRTPFCAVLSHSTEKHGILGLGVSYRPEAIR